MSLKCFLMHQHHCHACEQWFSLQITQLFLTTFEMLISERELFFHFPFT